MSKQISIRKSQSNTQSKQISNDLTQPLIQTLQQKVYAIDQFFPTHSAKLVRHQQNTHNTSVVLNNFQPVVGHKKLSLDPKFIFSIERKKARIMSSLKQQYIEPKIRQEGLTGSVVRHYRNYSIMNKKNVKPDYYIQKFVEQNQKKANKNILKSKKNPLMNFSLSYILDKKKQIQNQIFTERRPNTAKTTKVGANLGKQSRQKGSGNPYLHMIMTQFSNPNTSRKIRPASEIQRKTQSQVQTRQKHNNSTNQYIQSARFQSEFLTSR